ncbi:MAG: hypothetical protein JXR96_22765 [Deltaproteobacteria bacterium]|nr:hypothetical protein [Deltaproteobacteria bacterium]
MADSARLERLSVVLVGAFNPAIFQPSWFAVHNLILSDENKIPSGIKLGVVHPQFVDFSTENFQIQVMQQRMWAATGDVSFYDSLRDLMYGTFTLLSHTPIIKMGINREFHFQMPSEDEWNAVGDRLVPKDGWKRVLERPGMESITIQGARTDGRLGFVRVRVEPSRHVQPFGVFVEVNDHYEVTDPETVEGCRELVDTMVDVWSESLERAEQIARTMVLGVEEDS